MASFMIVLAVITWIGGIIAGIVLGVQLESFWIFLGIAFSAVISGSLFAAVSLMLSSLNRLEGYAISIKNSLKLITEKQETPVQSSNVSSDAPKETRPHYWIDPTSNTNSSEEKETEFPLQPTEITCPHCNTPQPCNRVRCCKCDKPLRSESIPYVCGKCGHPGPYDGACPDCGSTMKAY